MLKQPLVSVVVLNWNSSDTIFTCLDSIDRLKYRRFEIIVLDNGSLDGSVEKLVRRKGIKLIELDSNRGFAGGQIEALKYCKGEYIALINSDALIDEQWLSVLVEKILKNNHIGAIGGRSYKWDGGTRHKGDYYSYQEINPFTAGSQTLEYDLETDKEVGSLSGAAVLISRQAIEDVGYFYEPFFAYYEESDLFARMLRSGYKIIYTPQAIIWHQVAKSLGEKSYQYSFYMHKNRFLFAIRNFDKPYLTRFVGRYIVKDLLINPISYIVKPATEKKARLYAAIWNIKHLAKTFRSRKRISSKGSYNKLLLKYQAPHVSIIIPNYNYGNFVQEAIESAKGQTYLPSEIIVVDDGSTDNSREVLNQYKGQPLVKIELRSNVGVVQTKNFGATLSRGEWLLYLDADDYLEKDAVELYCRQLALKPSKQLGFVYSAYRLVGSDSRLIRVPKFNRFRLAVSNYIHNGALIRKDAFINVNGYDELFSRGYEDWDLFMSLVGDGWIGVREKKSLYNYRIHEPTSRNQRAERSFPNIIKALRSKHVSLYTPGIRFAQNVRFSQLGKITVAIINGLGYLTRGDLRIIRAKIVKKI